MTAGMQSATGGRRPLRVSQARDDIQDPELYRGDCLKTRIGNVHPRLGVGFRNKQGLILFSEAKDHS
jgi:hypothetical protein